jgi:hypothetical protein
MKKQWLGIVLTVGLASCGLAQLNPQIHALPPFDNRTTKAVDGATDYIEYHGGPIFEVTPDIYIVYYGNWTNKDHSVIDSFFQYLGGTTMDKINTTYSDKNNKFEPNAVHYDPTTDSYDDHYSFGHSIDDADIQKIIANAISAGHLPNDTNGIYFVLTAKDVTDTDGFCTVFCGYHGPSTSIVSGEIIKYAMVGNPAQCPTACEASAVIGDKNSPNNDPGADGAVSIMWAEFSESTSDPEVGLHTAWEGDIIGENGAYCAWQFGTLHLAPNGSHYNEKFHGKECIAQMMLKLLSKSRKGEVPGVCKNTF